MSGGEENKDHPIDYEITVPMVLPVRNDTPCDHGAHQFNLDEGNKRLTMCTYQRQVLVDVREFIGDRSTIKEVQLTTRKYLALNVRMLRASGELLRQMKLLRDS